MWLLSQRNPRSDHDDRDNAEVFLHPDVFEHRVLQAVDSMIAGFLGCINFVMLPKPDPDGCRGLPRRPQERQTVTGRTLVNWRKVILAVLSASAWLRRGIVLVLVSGAAAATVWYFAIWLPPAPNRPLRIGFEINPPVQTRTDSGFAGLAVETVSEAARRAGVQLRWVETGTSSDASFQKGLVDLWPLMADLPERHKRVHITRPWLHSNHVLLLRNGTANPGQNFAGRIAVFKIPIHLRLVRSEFPDSQ